MSRRILRCVKNFVTCENGRKSDSWEDSTFSRSKLSGGDPMVKISRKPVKGMQSRGLNRNVGGGLGPTSFANFKHSNLEVENNPCKIIRGYLLPGDLDSAYVEAMNSGDEMVLVDLLDKTGPVLESLSNRTANDILSTLASFLSEQQFISSIIPWLQLFLHKIGWLSAPQEMIEAEPLDFENNAQLWLLPEPEDEEDESEEWGYTRNASNLGSGEFRNRERSNEEHKKAMKTVVDGHFRALVSKLLQVENLDDTDNWLEIITSLSWEAASLLKPDTSKGGGMDPGCYVKIKCLASGRPSDKYNLKPLLVANITDLGLRTFLVDIPLVPADM
ncbi:ARM repeat superfamily protein [Artemisia annua]|uniref:ARM repeat superfamily protein n=1 Tax=Artemisia annua TaxID=35608 RepID=A0A2U1NNF4_ARTAN|nr:ARM repeat superfamily protein [Artemisia annua]